MTARLVNVAPRAGSAQESIIWVGALDASLGAWLLGTFCGLILYGILVYQTYQYYRGYPSDSPLLKAWVSTLASSLLCSVVESLNTIFTMHSSYFYFVTHYNHSIIFNDPPIWTLTSLAVTGPVAITISQAFFARRVYILAPRFKLVVYIAVILLVGFCGCFLALAVESFRAPSFFAQSLPFSGYVAAGVLCIMGADIQLTAVLIHVLRRSRTGMRRTDSLIDVLVLYAFSTGLMNCLTNVMDLAFALAFLKTMIYTSFSIALTKLHGNSFLVALNTRHSFAQRGLAGSVVSSSPRNGLPSGPRVALSVPIFADPRVAFPPPLTTTTTDGTSSLNVDSRTSAIELKVLRNFTTTPADNECAYADVPK
ncbi:hypothetical protein BD413DRAFT_228567 [Trametes elegans]|nr:hypothetical protein BD413DRAFT_228567 [Trametes elegans]